MKVGIYQNNPEFGATGKNVEEATREISLAEADLIVLPELFNTGYQFTSIQEVETLAEEIPTGNTCRRMLAVARDKNMFIVFGMAERDGKDYFNSAALMGPEGYIGKYRKTHLFFEEPDFFSPGNTGFCVFDIGRAKIGIMICFDWWFPESARALALAGADIICHCANLVLPNCQTAMITRSLENGVFTVTANRVGTESRGGKNPLNFTGGSQIVDNLGEIKARMGKTEPGFMITEVDPIRARNKAITARNDRFMDRHPEYYGTLTSPIV